MEEIYLDNSATTRVSDDVLETMLDYYKNKYGNPSSMHKLGIEAEKGIKSARSSIARFLNVYDKEIFFTSGGTEGNNIAIRGVTNRHKRRGNHIITTKIEHPSVLNVFKVLEAEDFDVTYIDVDEHGLINLGEFESCIREDTILVSIMMVNNEVGSIQPIQKIGRIIKAQNEKCIFHVDGVQAVGKIPCNPKKLGIDLLTISSHKIHGPKGIGALYINRSINVDPIIFGGGQESNLRSGTENVPGIVGLGKAIELIDSNFNGYTRHLYKLRELTREKITKEIENVSINGSSNSNEFAPHILSVSFPGLKGEVLLHSLEQDGIYVSTGSACSSKKKGRSHVLINMGMGSELIEGTMRISFSIYNNEEEILSFINILKKHVHFLRKIIRR